MRLEHVRGESCPDGVSCPNLFRSRGEEHRAILQGYVSTEIPTELPRQRVVEVPDYLVVEAVRELGPDVRPVRDGWVAVRGVLVDDAEAVGDVVLADGELLIELPGGPSAVLVGHR